MSQSSLLYPKTGGSGLITFTSIVLRPGIPSPQLHIGLLPDWMWGSVLRWWLIFPLAGFSPAGEYELCSARPRHPCAFRLDEYYFINQNNHVRIRTPFHILLSHLRERRGGRRRSIRIDIGCMGIACAAIVTSCLDSKKGRH